MEEVTISEFLGWYVGDGCISVGRYSEFTLTGDLSEEIDFYKRFVIPSFNKIFSNILKKPVPLKKYKSNSVCGIYLFDKAFVNYLIIKYGLKEGKKLNISLPNSIKRKSEKIGFLRGLFDTDGSIYFGRSNFKPKKPSFCNKYHYKPRIKLGMISSIMIHQVHGLLTDLGIKSRIQKPYQKSKREKVFFSLVIDTDKDVLRFIDTIGFRNPKHSTKVDVWLKFGFCPPYTKIEQRKLIILDKLSPYSFYSN